MTSVSLVQQSGAFLEHVDHWFKELPVFFIDRELAYPEQTAVFSADMVVGFCSQGSLASPRVASLVPKVVELFQRAYSAGVRKFVLAQDTHHEDAPEFRSFPPHCVRGTEESQTIPELSALPTVVPSPVSLPMSRLVAWSRPSSWRGIGWTGL